jgi:hypothetical protein
VGFFFLQALAKRNWEDSEANLYWKYKAKEFYAKTQEADKTQEKLDNLSNRLTNNSSSSSYDFINEILV